MKILYKSTFVLMAISLLLGTVAFAADAEYRFMHNNHDTLIIGEITAIDGEKAVIRAADYIVSSVYMPENGVKFEQLRPEIVTVNGMFGYDIMKNAKVGDYVLVSLLKSGDEYNVAWGAFLVNSLDYKTLKVTALSPKYSAMYTDFVNSGGLYTEYGMDMDTVIRRSNGVETVIYQREQADTANISQTQQPENNETKDPINYKLYIFYGVGFIVVLLAIIFIIRKNKR